VTIQPGDQTGTGALQALPDGGTNRLTDYASNSPRLDYWVNFRYTGTHYVWIRGKAATTGDDTLHLGFAGSTGGMMDKVTGFGPNFGWTNSTLDGPPARINVTSTGNHRFSIYMGEDGIVIDKVIIARESSFVPTGSGPPEAP
jgi:Gylcosyl hydrolase family 115 C-terminal domain